MAKILLTAQVTDINHWRNAINDRNDLLRSLSLQSPISFCVDETNNEIALVCGVGDVSSFLQKHNSDDAQQARKADGFIEATVRLRVLDQEFEF